MQSKFNELGKTTAEECHYFRGLISTQFVPAKDMKSAMLLFESQKYIVLFVIVTKVVILISDRGKARLSIFNLQWYHDQPQRQLST